MISGQTHYIIVDDDSTSNLIGDFIIRKFDKNAVVDLYLIPEEALGDIESKYSQTVKPVPSVLFLDVNMPTMSGFEFLDELQKIKPEIQHNFEIYILSSSIEDFTSQAKAYPFVAGFLSKPLSISHLEKIRKK